jgi:hypothetical protein
VVALPHRKDLVAAPRARRTRTKNRPPTGRTAEAALPVGATTVKTPIAPITQDDVPEPA